MKGTMGRCVLASYEGGSNSKPYLGFIGLGVDPEREFNKWNEKCLNGTVAIANLEPFWFDYRQALFNIGEHAISRIFERGKPIIYEGFNVDIPSILSEMEMIPMWSAYWAGTMATFKNFYSESAHLVNNFSLPIPSPNGLFLAELFEKNSASVEIRTFVNDERLSFEQGELRKVLLNAGNGLVNSPMTLYPLVDTLKIDETFSETAMISHHLLNSFDVVVHALFRDVLDDVLRSKLQEEFRKFLREMAKFTNVDLINLYKKLGVKRFHLELKKSIYKQGTKK